MLNAFHEGKDLYAVIASKCFHNDYEDNLEFDPRTGKLNPDGKARRAKAKMVLLGLTYGMSANTLADRMSLPINEANDIINSFYSEFKGVKKLTEDSQNFLRTHGYVEDMWGRRRHLPDGALEAFEIKSKHSTEFNPLIGSVPHENKALELKINSYKQQLLKARSKKQRDDIVKKADADGLMIKNNGGFINRAMRQCLNSRIQGTAASMTKYAMVLINNDDELKSLGFRLLATIHDEVFGEAPTENAELASKRLSEIMVLAAKSKCSCDFKCDGYTVTSWYEDENIGNINAELVKGATVEDVIKKYNMFNKDSIYKIANKQYEIGIDSLKYGPNYFKRD